MVGQHKDDPELTFHDLIADPLIRTIMAADGIDERELRERFDRASEQRTRQTEDEADRAESVHPAPAKPLRRGVGIMLLNRQGHIFVGQRNDVSDEAWQMPQGGIDPGEAPRVAALRELREELGIADVDVVAATHD